MNELRSEHLKTIWCHYAIAFFGFWLLTGQFAFGSTSFFSLNDAICGLLLIATGLLSISYKRIWAPWASCLIGIWIQTAPLLFWAPNASIYVNDTLIGALVFAFSILIPGMPGQLPDHGPSIPPNWSYNPSSWPQRIPTFFLATVGWFISRYLAAYQLGYIDTVWDPFFPNGTLHVITSSVSKQFPVSDAGLGALAYTFEALFALKGNETRWRSMPWMVVLFGIVVVPLSLVSIILIILQPLSVGAWCSLCLFTAFCMMILIALAVDEVAAVLQFLRQCKREQKPLWPIFWKGGPSHATPDHRTPPLDAPLQLFPAMCWGVTLPYNLLLSALIGTYLMLTPWIFSFTGLLADIDHVFGALAIVASTISLAEVIRPVRFANLLFGAILILSSLFPFSWPLFLNQLIAAGLLIALSFRRGQMKFVK